MKEITMPEREDLYSDYVLQKMTLGEIAKKYGVSSYQTVKRWMAKYGIPLRVKRRKISVPEKEILRKMYLTDNMEAQEIAEHFGVSSATVFRWIRGYGLAVKKEQHHASIPTKEVLRKMYLTDNMEAREIAEYFSVPQATAAGWLRDYGLAVKRENLCASIPGKETLRKMYLTDNMSAREIAESCGVHINTVYRRLRDCGLTVKRQNRSHKVPSTAYMDAKETEEQA